MRQQQQKTWTLKPREGADDMPTGTDEQVLVIEDDPDIRHIVRWLLEDEGYAVLEAPDGAVGLRLLARTHEALIALVDYRMPHMDGFEMLRAVAGDGMGLKRHVYVLVTADRDLISPAFARLLAEHHIPILDKPFDMDTLLHTITEAHDHMMLTHEQWAPGD
jgi:CheY-like chemotaxis protein